MSQDTNQSRLAVLEKQVKLMRTALICVVAVGLVAVLMGAATSWDSVRTSKIIVPRAARGSTYSHILTFEAEGGQKMAELQLRNHGPALWVYDNTGRQVLNLGASANDYGGYVDIAGKPGENSSVHLGGRGFYLMGRPGGGPWMSLDRFVDNYCRLIIRGKGAETITLDNVNGAPRVEVLDADGKATLLTP